MVLFYFGCNSRPQQLQMMEQGCKEGNVEYCYFFGEELIKEQQKEQKPPDKKAYEEITEAFVKACDGNFGKACDALGDLYRRGVVVNKSEKRLLSTIKNHVFLELLEAVIPLQSRIASVQE